jgi:Domain of unknown function (DUF1707)
MPDPHLRAADADRSAVADLLGRHMATGRLTVAEYDERLARAYAARTYGELAELTADLPPERTREPAVPAAQPAPQPVGGCAGPGGMAAWGPWTGTRTLRAAWASWVSTAVIVVGIWLLTSVASGWVYPWPLWVIGPWGIVLLSRTLGGGRPGRDRQRHRRPERLSG